MALDKYLSRLRRLAPVIITRTFLVGVVVIAYLVAWRPARGWIVSEVMRPALTHIDTPRSDQYSFRSKATTIEVYRTDSLKRLAKSKPPLGRVFILVGMVFIATELPISYWLYMVPYQLTLTFIIFGLMIIGVGWSEWGFTICNFLHGGFYEGTSFAIPFLILRAERRTFLINVISRGTGSDTGG